MARANAGRGGPVRTEVETYRPAGLWDLVETGAGLIGVVLLAAAASFEIGSQLAIAGSLVLAAASMASGATRPVWLRALWMVPLASALLSPDVRVAAALAGVTSAASTAAVLIPSGHLRRGAVILLVSAWAFAARLAPLEGFPLAESLIVAAGASLLALTTAGGRAPRAADAGIGVLASLLALPAPPDAMLMPALLAAFVAAGRSRNWLFAALACAAALLAGKWIMPALVIVAVGWIRARRLDGERLAVPVLGGALPQPAALVHAAAWPLWVEAAAPARFGALLLVGGALVIERPWVSAVWIVAALVVLLADDAAADRRSALAGIVMLVGAGLGWSGAVAGAFPSPGSIVTNAVLVLSLALILAAPGMVRAGGGLVAAAALFYLVGVRGDAAEQRILDRELRPGDSVVIRHDGRSASVRLHVRGANIADVSSMQPLAAVRLVSGTNGGVREIFAGEIGDWGGRRRDHLFAARAWPRRDAGVIDGAGRAAAVQGGRSIELAGSDGIDALQVSVRSDAPADAVLVLERLEWRR